MSLKHEKMRLVVRIVVLSFSIQVIYWIGTILIHLFAESDVMSHAEILPPVSLVGVAMEAANKVNTV